MTTADETKLVHAGLAARGGGPAPVNPPVVRTSTVVYPDLETMRATKRGRETGERHFSYGRRGTPTAFALEDALVELERGHRATLHPSGLAAIAHVFLAFLKPGDHLLVTDAVYAPVRGLCEEFLASRGIAHEYFPGDPQALAARLRPETRMIYTENPGSLTYEIQDLPAIARVAYDHGVLLAVDNTWGAGLLHKPLTLGADLSIQALTKYVVGHSDVMLGAVVANERAWQPLWKAATHLGQCVGPDDAYLALRGLRSMAPRLAMHEAHARAVAEWLLRHPLVADVLYPALPTHPGHALWRRDFTGANGLLTVALRDGVAPGQVDRFVGGLRLFGIGSSWGGFESLVLPVEPKGRGSTRYAGPLVRLHIGLEHPDDLVADLDQALSNAVPDAAAP
jgi:cystathionine beta-lyase